MTFGERIREYRRAILRSQEEIAAAVDSMALDSSQHLDTVTLSKIENNRLPPPSYPVICHLAVALSPTSDINPAAVMDDLSRLSKEPFIPAPPIDQLAFACGRGEDDLEAWQAKLAAWNEAAAGECP